MYALQAISVANLDCCQSCFEHSADEAYLAVVQSVAAVPL